MEQSPAAAIETALNEADGILRRRLADHGLEHSAHFMLVLAPDGGAVFRSNCGSAELRAMASFLVEMVERGKADNGVKPP
jgi:hypothetical protein